MHARGGGAGRSPFWTFLGCLVHWHWIFWRRFFDEFWWRMSLHVCVNVGMPLQRIVALTTRRTIHNANAIPSTYQTRGHIGNILMSVAYQSPWNGDLTISTVVHSSNKKSALHDWAAKFRTQMVLGSVSVKYFTLEFETTVPVGHISRKRLPPAVWSAVAFPYDLVFVQRQCWPWLFYSN